MSNQWYVKLYDHFPDYNDEPYTQGTPREVDFIEQVIESDHSKSILDVGCGTGRHVLELARRGYQHVVGVDLSESLLAQGRQVAQAEKLSVEFVVRDARALDYKAAFYVALSICEGALSLMETDEMERKILDNIAAALKPGGVFIATVPNAAFMLAQTSDDTTFDPVTHRETFTLDTVTAGGKSETLHCEQRYYTCPELKSLLAQTGFTEIEFFAVKPEGPTWDEQPSAHDFELGVIARKKL